MHVAVITAEPLDVARGSGTAVAIAAMRDALQLQGVASSVVVPRRQQRSQTMQRLRFNRSLRAAELRHYDAVIGVNGDGYNVAAELHVPFVAALKAFYAGAAQHERGATRRLVQLHARWEAAGARAASVVMVPSLFAARSVTAAYHLDASTVHVVPEPFDVERWQASLPAARRQGGRVLCVAHLYPRKRIADLVAAWPLVVSKVPGARLDIAGHGPELRRVSSAALRIERCYAHGHIDADGVRQLHQRADVFCLPSAQETFGYAAVEAMASGLPLVVADAGALAEVTEAAVAIRVTPGDIEQLAAALITALRTPGLAGDAAARNPEVAAAFAPSRVGPMLFELLSPQRRAGGSASRRAGSAQ